MCKQVVQRDTLGSNTNCSKLVGEKKCILQLCTMGTQRSLKYDLHLQVNNQEHKSCVEVD